MTEADVVRRFLRGFRSLEDRDAAELALDALVVELDNWKALALQGMREIIAAQNPATERRVVRRPDLDDHSGRAYEVSDPAKGVSGDKSGSRPVLSPGESPPPDASSPASSLSPHMTTPVPGCACHDCSPASSRDDS